jgi:hypothetical protein
MVGVSKLKESMEPNKQWVDPTPTGMAHVLPTLGVPPHQSGLDGRSAVGASVAWVGHVEEGVANKEGEKQMKRSIVKHRRKTAKRRGSVVGGTKSKLKAKQKRKQYMKPGTERRNKTEGKKNAKQNSQNRTGQATYLRISCGPWTPFTSLGFSAGSGPKLAFNNGTISPTLDSAPVIAALAFVTVLAPPALAARISRF